MNNLSQAIKNKFTWYDDLYLQSYLRNITNEDMLIQLNEKLNKLDTSELNGLTEIGLKVTITNCPWSVYYMSQVVNMEIMKMKVMIQ